ncbi:hypothetical protein [Aeromonas veronii]|uniref:hypothetical protein n=1 Tax=Aeromonas veronii TaxID=654 RepID=UPI000E09BA9F|nr:hypothetical protein [Aeromonas veronii]RDE60929.1 hypothetical protein DV708_16645 [Aeromonas veronii]
MAGKIMKSLDYYTDLVPQGPIQIEAKLTKLEAIVVMKAYDYGVASLEPDEQQQLNNVIGKLKQQIWP